jgi:hypothetical protein
MRVGGDPAPLVLHKDTTVPTINFISQGWRSRTHAVLWCLSTFAALVFGGVLSFATAGDAWRTRAVPPTPPEVTRDLIVKGASDTSGRQATFRILLFTDEFRWRLSSADTLENGQSSPVFTTEMKAVLNTAREIICVGASSEEIAPGVSLQAGRVLEERRAARRAERIAVWVREALSRPIPTRKLNAGHHLATLASASDTSDQRRVVIILVLDHEQGTNIDEALRTAMMSESVRAPIFQTLLTQYSLASRPRFSWAQ